MKNTILVHLILENLKWRAKKELNETLDLIERIREKVRHLDKVG